MTVNRVNLPAQDRSRRRGSGFTNIDRIIGANQNNRLGSTIQSGITKSAQDTKEDVQQQTSGFQQQSQAGRLGTQQDKQKREDVFSRFNQSGNTNTQYTNEQDIKDFDRFRSGEYKGPLGLASDQLQKAQGKASQAESLGNLTQSAPGQQQLLRRFAGGEGYTRGQQRLDTLLLGQTGGENLRQARRETVGLGEQVSRAAEGARQQGESFRREAEEFGAETRQGLLDRFSQRDEVTKARVDTALNEALTQRADLLGKLQAEQGLTNEDYASLGLTTPEEIEQFNVLMEASGQEYVSGVDISGEQLSFVPGAGFATNRTDFGTQGIENLNKAVDTRFAEMQADRDAGLVLDPNTNEKFRIIEQDGRSYKEYPNRPELNQDITGAFAFGFGNTDPATEEAFRLSMGMAPSDEELQNMAFQDVTKSYNQANYSSDGTWQGTSSITPVGWRQVTGSLTGPQIANLFKEYSVGQEITPELAAQLGLADREMLDRFNKQSPSSIARVSGINKSVRDDFEFERFLDQVDPTRFTQESVATQDELAQMNALQRLMGQEGQFDESLAETAQGAGFRGDEAIQAGYDALFGKDNVAYNPVTGQFVARDSDTANILSGLDSIAEQDLLMLNPGFAAGATALSEVIEGVNKIDGIEGVYDFTDAVGSIGGDLNPISLASEGIGLGAKYVDEFADSVGEKLGKVAGTVICGELHRQGIMSDELYKKDCKFTEELKKKDLVVYEGYYCWAQYVAKAMSKSKLLTDIIKPFGMAWANQMAGKENKLGKLILTVGKPLCKAIGKIRRFCLGVK